MEPIRRAPARVVIVFIGAHFALITIVNLIVFAGEWLRPLAAATGGLITGTLVVNLILIATLVIGVMMLYGGQRPVDLGLIARRLPAGVMFPLGVWALAQFIHAIAGWLAHGTIALNPAWSTGATALIGLLLAQVLGNALFEEIAYRGFLFPQLYFQFSALRRYRWWRVSAAVAAAGAVFALSHIPNRIYLGLGVDEIVPDLLMLTVWGLLYTLIYLRTDNLFLTVGVHALGNAPTTLLTTAPALDGAGASFLIYGLAALALFGIPLVRAAARLHRAEADLSIDPDPMYAVGD